MPSAPREEIRLQLVLHYDGSDFHGWQLQPDARTVQGELERVVERLTGRRRPVVGSGRTDAGVHATGQVAAVDLPASWDAERFRTAANALLPRDVRVQSARRVGPVFHPRYDASARTYEYRLGLTEAAWSPFQRSWCWPLKPRLAAALDRALLDEAAATLPGERSFKAFAKAGQPERGERCHVRDAAWSAWDEMGLRFTIRADRYLHHMVRYLVGTMVEVATGGRPLAELRALLERPDGTLETSPPAPPEGLFLVRVEYPAEALDPGRTERPIPDNLPLHTGATESR